MLRATFRPEFLNRLDEITFFKPLSKAEIGKIVRLLTKTLQARLAEKQLGLTLDDSAVEYIIEQGYDPVYGARPLKRYMQQTLETALAKNILAGKFTVGDNIRVLANENGLTVDKE